MAAEVQAVGATTVPVGRAEVRGGEAGAGRAEAARSRGASGAAGAASDCDSRWCTAPGGAHGRATA